MNVLNHGAVRLLASTDVLVIGGGSAGCCAALAARQAGARVTLVERYGFLGGTSTQMLDTFYGFFTPGESPRKVVGGIPDRVVDRLDGVGAVFLRPNTYGAGTGVNYNPERLKWVWDELLSAAGVRVLLHTTLVDVALDGPGRALRDVVVSTKSGFFRLAAQRFIDTSGDADLCHLAGIPYEKAGDVEPAQTLTTTFRMSNVDLSAYERAGGKKLLAQLMAKAVDDGTHPLPRKSGSLHPMNAVGCISTVAVRVADIDATDVEQLGAAEREGRRQAFVYEQFFRDCVPGFAKAHIIGLSPHIGVRETRRVFGEYRLTKEDCLSVARFPDKIALCGAPIEDHRAAPDGKADETVWNYVPNGGAYDVPYRTLVPRGRNDVWVAGRCFSATHDAHASCRSMGQTMSMGQAAGFAAALSLQHDCGARAVPIHALQDTLLRAGAVLEFPDRVAATGAADWQANRS